MTNSKEPPDRSTRTPAPTETRRLRWWVAGITFVAGFVAGIITVGLLGLGTPDFATQAEPGGGTSGPTTGPSPRGSVPVVAQARVNAACLAVINEAQDISNALSGLGEAVTDVDLQQLDDIVRRLQPIDARLRQDLQRCEVDADISADPGETPTAQTATAEPTSSPTR